MQLRCQLKSAGQRGLSLIEVLVTMIIEAFGLLGISGLQSRIQVAEIEGYQRAQAILLLSEMTERVNTNRSQAATYAFSGSKGAGDGITTCATTPGKDRDLCEWSNALQGATETLSTAKVGAMAGARGCITQVQAENTTTGVCTPGQYRVDVAWQGMIPTAAPTLTCGDNKLGANYSSGTNDKYRRVISLTVTVGTTSCS